MVSSTNGKKYQRPAVERTLFVQSVINASEILEAEMTYTLNARARAGDHSELF